MDPEYSRSAADAAGVGPDDVVIIPRELYQEREKWETITNDLVAAASSG